MSTYPTTPRRLRRAFAGAALVSGLGAGVIGLAAAPAAAAPEPYLSSVEGNIAVKGSPAAFSGVSITGTYDADTGDLTARATFPKTTQLRENNPAPGFNAEVVLQVSQPEPAEGTVVDGVVTLDAEFQMVVESLTLINQADGSRTPLPLGPTPDSCRFGPIEVGLTGTAEPSSEGGPLRVSVSDPEFVIPQPADPANDCGPLGSALIPNIAGPNEGEDPNSAELSFTLSSSQAVVEAIYQTVLGRSAEPDGLAYWAGRIQTGTSPTAVAIAVARSAEGWANAVVDSYGLVLDRAPEVAGVRYWVDTMGRAQAQDQPFLVGYLAGSPEGGALAREQFPEATSGTDAYVRFLYSTLLGRAPSEGDVTFWTTRIETATSQVAGRQAAGAFFYRSPEIVARFVSQASIAACGEAATGEHAQTLANAFTSSGYKTRVLLAVATVTPCPEASTGG